MIVLKKFVLYVFELVLFCASTRSIVSAAASKKLRSSRTTAADHDDIITCRIYMRSILYETETNEIRSKLQAYCGVVDDDGLETHETHLVVLPKTILATYENEIQVGTLFVSIQDATVSDDTVVVQQDSQLKILNHQVQSAGRRHGRRLAAPVSQTTGTRILKVYRVLASNATANDPPSLTALETAIFGNTVSVKTQYSACSNGLLIWTNTSTAVETVQLDRHIDTFTRYDELVTYTIQLLIARGKFVQLEDVADNVIFAVPLLTKGATSQNGFIGQGDVLGRKSIFSHKWAGDHLTLMHEVGHNFGLVHAGIPSDDFALGLYGDPTTFMGATQNTAISDGPQKCINAYHMTHMKWFNGPKRTMTYDPSTQGRRKISVAAFEHTAKATSSQPNIVIIKNELWLLYNLGVDYNKGAGHKGGATIVSFGQQFNQGRTRIEGVIGPATNTDFAQSKVINGVHFNLCSVEAATTETAASMILGISLDGTGCAAPLFTDTPAPAPAPRPLPAPVPAPRPVPAPVPAPRPAPRPVPAPVPAPIPAPIPAPRPAPVPAPVPAPRPAPAPVPAPRPAPRPVPAPRPAPRPVPAPVPAPRPAPVPVPIPAPIGPIDLLSVDPILPSPINVIGNRTLKVFRVVGREPTANDPPSIEAMQTMIFLSPRASIMQQYRKSSTNQFFWVDAGIENIILDLSIGEFLTNAELQIYVLTHLRKKGKFSVKLEEIAQNVLLAVPKLTNPAASALDLEFQGQGYQQRRLSMFSGIWATDFSTVMKQLGHNLGMIDASSPLGEGDDSTTFMGAPPSTRVKSNGPLQSVNGYGAWYTKWFNNRTMSFNPKLSGPRKIGLAALVHYKWAEGSTPVVLVVTGDRKKKLYVTYNVRFGHIKELGDYENSVTIVTTDGSAGQERTTLRAKIDANQTATNFAGVAFEVCGFVDAVFQVSPAQMVLSISRDGNGCNAPLYAGPLDAPR